MTRDADDYDDPCQYINIRLKDDKDNKLKDLFEKGLNALLADEYFLLLYVPENGAKMQIVQPATDSYHRKRMIKRINEATRIPSFYYALSHLWGITEDNRHMWEEISEYVDDINGQPVDPVSMRDEKRGPLLAMLRDHPDSYWWIDVLCARTDTPLDIMGDIYACCLECIAMIDCEPGLIPKLYTKQRVKEDIVELWTRDQTREEMSYFKQLYEEYPLLLDHLFEFSQSKWWQRVWTWQEMALPLGEVRFIAETGTQALEGNTITMDGLLNSVMNASCIIYYIANEFDSAPIEEEKEQRLLEWIAEITQTRSFSKRRFEKSAQTFLQLFVALETSSRRCMDPVDYVYGLLGMFQIKIPRLSDPNEVWQTFLSELDDYMEDMKNEQVLSEDNNKGKLVGINDDAKQVDLRKARNMADVYKDIIYLEMIDDDEE
ncbi:hypothetical protein O0I10_011769 [Lichtheimia ornata]|uniref:Heterokaryon incompatibility domain-containing protein n=1 Tax=Lichtheimia ornata TaxID=688661 RepID=A0AAD7XQ55_9FUNG|nr:uncharacterized protein O0I10_011769 [Lichtheimia ornata]KAJ8652564.1 hypothetical protein O0I10_011769 [Lichtheimia ornata]